MRKSRFFLSFLLILWGMVVFAQNRTITGKAVNQRDKSSLANVTVNVKGTKNSIASGPDGSFTISAPDRNVTLVVSSIGFLRKEVVVGPGMSSVTIELEEDTRQLSEVVVTALGINRQAKTLVYATQSIKPSQLTEVRDPNNVLNSLQGKVANAVITQGSGGPGSGARIVLRGNKSIQQSNNALIVVDGVPINNDTYSTATSDFGSIQSSDGASNINPDDIESMTILRGASAAALYGSQAGNGVIVIATKRGRKDNKASAIFNSGIGFESPFALPKFQNSYGQGNSGILDSAAGASWGPKMDGRTFTNYLGQQSKFSPQPDNIHDFFRTGVSVNNSIGISGGNEKVQTYVSYTNSAIQGIIRHNDLMRHNITARLGAQVTKRLSVDAKATYIIQDIKNMPRTGEENAPVIDVYQTPRNVSVADASHYQDFDRFGVPIPSPWPSTNNSIYQNPYWMINNMSIGESRDRIIGFLSAKYQLTDWLNIKGRVNLDRAFTRIEQSYSQGTNLWTTQGGGAFGKNNFVGTQRWFDLILEGENRISRDFKVNYHAGAIFQDYQYNQDFSGSDGLFVTNKFSLNYAANPTLASAANQVQTQSVFGQANFSYKDAIFLDASLRNDWDSRIPSPYSYTYPSVGVSAVLSDLMTLPKSISFLKASVNYAQVGNGGQSQVRFNTYGYTQGAGNGFLARSTTLAIPNLKPEIVKSWEFGIDARFLNDRLGFTVTYYKSNSFNQLITVGLPVATGYTNQYINAGNIQNQGVELVLNATPVKSRDFTWDLQLNMALNRNKVIALSDIVKTFPLGGGFGRSATPIIKEGGSYGDMIGFKWMTDAKGNHVVNAKGVPVTTGSQEYLGNFNPKETIGMTNSFAYKRFSLRLLIDGRIGGIAVSGTEMNLAFSGITEGTSKYREGGWNLGGVDASGAPVTQATNAQGFWQAASQQRYGIAEFFTYNATNFRVRELSFGYDIPVHEGNFIKTMRFSAVARNLFWLYRGKSVMDIPGLGKRTMWMDPDMSLGNGNFQGVEYGTLPATRTLGFNLKLTF